MVDAKPNDARARVAHLVGLATLFLRLGITAFGGPAVHASLMEAEVVRKRRWVSTERFLDLFGAANLIPGPSSSELALYIGYDQAGMLGLLIAGIGFIFPAAAITTLLAWAYVSFGRLPQVQGVMYGLKPVIIAIVLQALCNLVPKAAKNRRLIALGSLALLAASLHMDALMILVVAGALMIVLRGLGHKSPQYLRGLVPGALTGSISTAATITLSSIFLFFLKVGAVVFGSGYVLLAFLRADLVERWHWLTETQLLDAVVVGQVTPGPVFTTATFIGYLLAGIPGALVATIGIFLPGFILVALSQPLIARVRQSSVLSAFLDGVNVAALALMAYVTAQLGRAAVTDVPTLLLACAAGFLLFRWRVNSAWLLAGGAALGWVARSI